MNKFLTDFKSAVSIYRIANQRLAKLQDTIQKAAYSQMQDGNIGLCADYATYVQLLAMEANGHRAAVERLKEQAIQLKNICETSSTFVHSEIDDNEVDMDEEEVDEDVDTEVKFLN